MEQVTDLKKPYLSPELSLSPVSECDVIRTSLVYTEASQGDLWNWNIFWD